MSLFSLFLRLTVSLAVVLLLMRFAAGLLQRGMGGGTVRKRRGPAQVEVLLRQPLGRRASISVVRAGERALVLGVTEQSITLLAEDDPDVLMPPLSETPRTASLAEARPSGPAWTAVVDALRDRTVRRD